MDPETTTSDRALLEAFVIEDESLGQLEDLLADFNLFDAIGMVHQELRHSQLLAFLLDPSESHGLGDAFLTRFLKLALIEADDPPMSPIEIDVANLSGAEVRREWNQIDILVTDQQSKLTVVIENKVKADEHGDQLAKYRRIADTHFGDHRRLCLFLSPDERQPSDDRYLPVGYELVVRVVDAIVERRGGTLGDAVRTLLEHYATMIRRHVLSDSEVANLCQQLWKSHRRALELIYEHRPDVQSMLRDVLVRLTGAAAEKYDLDVHKPSKRYIYFEPNKLCVIGEELAKRGYKMSRAPAIFEIGNFERSLTVCLYVPPVPRPIQEAVFARASAEPELFVGAKDKLLKNWTVIYRRGLLRAEDYDELDEEELAAEVAKGWEEFLVRDLARLTDAVGASEWPTAQEG